MYSLFLTRPGSTILFQIPKDFDLTQPDDIWTPFSISISNEYFLYTKSDRFTIEDLYRLENWLTKALYDETFDEEYGTIEPDFLFTKEKYNDGLLTEILLTITLELGGIYDDAYLLSLSLTEAKQLRTFLLEILYADPNLR